MKVTKFKNGDLKIPINQKQKIQLKRLEKNKGVTSKYKYIYIDKPVEVGKKGSGLWCSGLESDLFLRITPKQFEIFKQDLRNAGYTDPNE